MAYDRHRSTHSRLVRGSCARRTTGYHSRDFRECLFRFRMHILTRERETTSRCLSLFFSLRRVKISCFLNQGGMCTVYLPTEDRVVNLISDQLEPVIPSRGDRVKIILGEDREAVGTLLSIDNQEGVVKLNTEEIKFLQLKFLCKMKAPST